MAGGARKWRWIGGGLAALAVAAAAVVYVHRDETVLRLASGPEVSIKKDLVYVAGSANPKHRVDVYAPPNARGAPVVHFIHGGYWIKGDKDFLAPITGLYGSVGVALARRGVVTFVPSYRLAPEVGIDGILDDVVAALKFTKEHAAEYGGDPSRLYVVGHSAGGHLTALLGSDPEVMQRRGLAPSAVAGFMPISAIWDVGDMHDKQDAAFNERVTYPVFGRDPSKYAAYSPLVRIGPGAPPFAIVVGTRDYPYLIPQANHARDRLTAVGAAPELHAVEGNDHDAMVLRFGAKDDDMTDVVVAFVSQVPTRSAAR
jgi:acetyl esterase/lipase